LRASFFNQSASNNEVGTRDYPAQQPGVPTIDHEFSIAKRGWPNTVAPNGEWVLKILPESEQTISSGP
jgi:hypothetical protein